MFAGILLIVAGILIAVFPALLSIIVAILLICLGILVLSTAHYHRKAARQADNPVVELIFRY